MTPAYDYESLSYEERIRRIGAILGKAVTLRLERERAEREAAEGASPESEEGQPSGHEPSTPELPADTLTLMRMAAITGYLHPRDATEFWGVSRTTAYRRLQHLEQGGWIVRHGQGKASRYHLTAKAHAALKRMKRFMQGRKTGKSGR